jgi:hypothetical protein
MRIHQFYVLMAAVALCLPAQRVHSADKKTEKINIYEVPTTGKITDVDYRPEFDEWCVKCREGENIAVYSYDRRSQKWGRVQFVPKKPEEKAKPPETSPPPESAPQAGKTNEAVHEAQRKPPEKVEKKTDKKWWDPLHLFKNDEKSRQPEGGK